jgi:hypothetical protein
VSGSKFCFDVSTWHMPTGFGMGVLFGNLRQVTECVTGEEHGRAIGICPDKAMAGKIITSVCRQAGRARRLGRCGPTDEVRRS